MILANKTRKLERRVTIKGLESQIIEAAQLAVIQANEQVNHISMMSQGLFIGLSGKLSPLLVGPESLQTALANLTNVAQAKGYNAISTVLPHILELPSSMYVHRGRQIVDIIVHVPLVALASKRLLYKQTDILFILPFKINEVDPELKHRDQEHAVWTIKQTGNFVATNTESSISYELSKDALDSCTRINDNWHCRHLIRRRDNFQNSCEVALYHSQMQDIHELCEVELSTIPETAVSIDNRRTIIYSKKQLIDVDCSFNNGSRTGPKQFRIEGASEIILPKGGDCTVSTLRHRWRADYYLEIEAGPRVLPIHLNFQEMLGAAAEELAKYVKDLELNPYRPVSFKKVYDAIGNIKEWHERKWVKWLLLAVALVVILGGVALFVYWYVWKRSHSELLTDATSVSAIFKRYLHYKNKSDNPSSEADDPTDGVTFSSASGSQSRPRPRRKVQEELRDMEEEMNRLLEDLAKHEATTSDSQKKVNDKKEEFENVFKRINRGLERERQRQEDA